MEQFPKIAKARLRGLRADLHPDAEQLNAFAENALAAQERESVLEHLSACADCRDSVALAVAARPEDAAMPKPSRGGFRWATFQWAAVAASVAIVTVAVIVVGPHQQQTAQRATETVALKQEPAPAAPQEKAQKPAANASTGLPAGAARQEKPAPGQEATGKRDKDSRNGAGLEDSYLADGVKITDGGFGGIGVYSRMGRGKQIDKAASSTSSSAKAAGGSEGSGPNFDKSTGGIVSLVPDDEKKKEAAQEAKGAAGGQMANVANQPAPATVELQGAAAKVQNAPPPSRDAENLRADARKDAGNELSKSRPESTSTATAANLNDTFYESVPVARGHAAEAGPQTTAESNAVMLTTKSGPLVLWRAVNGELQNNPAAGSKKWQDQHPASNIYWTSVAALGEQVWAGGKSGVLYHSSDNGQSWTKVSLTGDDIIPLGDVTTITISSPALIDVVLSTGDDWQTTDAGKSFRLLPRKP